MKEVESDMSIEQLRLMADGLEKGYYWDIDLVKHRLLGDTGEVWDQIVVLKGQRRKVLNLAHNSPMAGHLAAKKMTEALKRHGRVWAGTLNTAALPVLIVRKSGPTHNPESHYNQCRC